ncbi:hypothetical protein [Nostoc sphaeroides]|uniref:hypothetical protein n=1 Tax=Nostoc sphaeroides TaxID=446679 RepID=UPI0015F2F04B|nr:hypothetical protein [Nostoc sphaeroides]
MKKRPLGLVAIVVYKSFAALLLMVTAIASLLTLKNYQALEGKTEGCLTTNGYGLTQNQDPTLYNR